MEEIERISIMIMGIINHSRIGPTRSFYKWSDCRIFSDIKTVIGSKTSGLTYRVSWEIIVSMLESNKDTKRLIDNGRD